MAKGRKKKTPAQKKLEGAKKRPAQVAAEKKALSSAAKKTAAEKIKEADALAKQKADVISIAEAPTMPAHFKESKTLPILWKEVVEDMDRMNMLARTDMGTVAIYVDNLHRVFELQHILLKLESPYSKIKTQYGEKIVSHPAFADLHKCNNTHIKYAEKMGCTPGSRSSVPSLMNGELFGHTPEPKKEEQSPWAKFNS